MWIRRFAGFSGLVLASSGNSSCGLTRSGLGEGFNGESLAWPSGRGVLTLLLLFFLVFLFEFGWLDHCCEDLNSMTTSVRGRSCDKGVMVSGFSDYA